LSLVEDEPKYNKLADCAVTVRVEATGDFLSAYIDRPLPDALILLGKAY